MNIDNTTPLVSILIPTYNQADILENAIDSALSQTYENIEIIISDDCSSDSTEEICRKYLTDKRINYFRNPLNLGRVANYRKSLYDLANGEYVINVDGDDKLTDDNFIKESICFFNKYRESEKNADMLVACKQYNKNDEIIKQTHRIKGNILFISGVEFVLELNKKYEFSHLTTIYNRTKAIKHNFFRCDIISSDKESILRLALDGNVIIWNKIVGQWNLTRVNESKIKALNKTLENLEWIDSVYVHLKKKVKKYQSVIWRTRMRFIYSDLVLGAFFNQKKIGITQLLKLIKYNMLLYCIINGIRIAFNKVHKKIFSKEAL